MLVIVQRVIFKKSESINTGTLEFTMTNFVDHTSALVEEKDD